MKKLEFDLGGRPVTNDDLVTLQNEAAAATFALYSELGPFIVSGCQVTGTTNGAYTVSPGIVALDGQLLRYYGASSVTLPAQFQQGGFDFIDQRPYQTGGTKACIRERPAVLAANNPAYLGGQFIPLDTWGGKRWADVQRATVRSLGEVQWLASFSAADYDATTGLGLPGTDAWGWGLCDGQGGRADLRGHFVAGMDPGNSEYATPGLHGGKDKITLTVSQLPSHGHGSDFRITDSRTGDTSPFTAGWTSTPTANGKNIETTVTGGNQPFDNRPTFWVLAARQWVDF